ncbi:MAG: hypothetical protein KAT00_12815, partial [Planctomycetes bacterium]|nr:hypothetical protein [Planctomycetota bacterium]
ETSKKNYFLDVSGGPDSPHATVGPGFNTSGADIIPLTEDEAIQWVADNKEGEIETLFPGVVTDA